MKKEDEQVRIFRDYLRWKIYCRKKRYRQSDRDKLMRDFKRRFQAWNYEEKDNELALTDPEYGFPVTVRFGNFVTPSQQKYSVKIESQSFGWKRRHMRNHGKVMSRILKILPKGKKEAYREEKQRLVPIDVRSMKYFEGVFWGEDYYF